LADAPRAARYVARFGDEIGQSFGGSSSSDGCDRIASSSTTDAAARERVLDRLGNAALGAKRHKARDASSTAFSTSHFCRSPFGKATAALAGRQFASMPRAADGEFDAVAADALDNAETRNAAVEQHDTRSRPGRMTWIKCVPRADRLARPASAVLGEKRRHASTTQYFAARWRDGSFRASGRGPGCP